MQRSLVSSPKAFFLYVFCFSVLLTTGLNSLKFVQARKAAYPHFLAHQRGVPTDGTAGQIGLEMAQSGDTQGARPFFEQAVLDHPTSWTVHNNLAMVYLEKNMNREALIHYKKAYKSSPNNEQAHIQKKNIKALSDMFGLLVDDDFDDDFDDEPKAFDSAKKQKVDDDYEDYLSDLYGADGGNSADVFEADADYEDYLSEYSLDEDSYDDWEDYA